MFISREEVFAIHVQKPDIYQCPVTCFSVKRFIKSRSVSFQVGPEFSYGHLWLLHQFNNFTEKYEYIGPHFPEGSIVVHIGSAEQCFAHAEMIDAFGQQALKNEWDGYGRSAGYVSDLFVEFGFDQLLVKT